MSGDWVPWSAKVPQVEVETHKVASPDVVVPTLDTVRHESLLYTWLAEHKPMGKMCLVDKSEKLKYIFNKNIEEINDDVVLTFCDVACRNASLLTYRS